MLKFNSLFRKPESKDVFSISPETCRKNNCNRIFKIALGVSVALNIVYGYTICQKQAESKFESLKPESEKINHVGNPAQSSPTLDEDEIKSKYFLQQNHDLLYFPENDPKEDAGSSGIKL